MDSKVTNSEHRKQRLIEPLRKRLLGAFAFTCWIGIWSWFGFGIVQFAARPYTVLEPITSVSWLFFVILPSTFLILAYAKFRGYFGNTISIVVGMAAAPVMLFTLLGLLLPMHYREVCDTMDGMWACERATLRETCKPGLACFPRLEKACRLGSRNRCLALIKSGHSSEEKVCAILRSSCEKYNACVKSDTPECGQPYLPDVKPGRFSCLSYKELCETKVEPNTAE